MTLGEGVRRTVLSIPELHYGAYRAARYAAFAMTIGTAFFLGAHELAQHGLISLNAINNLPNLLPFGNDHKPHIDSGSTLVCVPDGHESVFGVMDSHGHFLTGNPKLSDSIGIPTGENVGVSTSFQLQPGIEPIAAGQALEVIRVNPPNELGDSYVTVGIFDGCGAGPRTAISNFPITGRLVTGELLVTPEPATSAVRDSLIVSSNFRDVLKTAVDKPDLPLDEWGCAKLSTPGILSAKDGNYPLGDTILNLRSVVRPNPAEPEPGFTTRLGTLIDGNGRIVATIGASSQHGGPEITTLCSK